MNMTLQQIDRGIAVDHASKDRAITRRVMRSERPMEDISASPLVAGDDNDSPFQFGRTLKARRGQDMAIHI